MYSIIANNWYLHAGIEACIVLIWPTVMYCTRFMYKAITKYLSWTGDQGKVCWQNMHINYSVLFQIQSGMFYENRLYWDINQPQIHISWSRLKLSTSYILIFNTSYCTISSDTAGINIGWGRIASSLRAHMSEHCTMRQSKQCLF